MDPARRTAGPGRVALLVAREPGEARHTPAFVVLTVEGPVPGDRWAPERDPERASQVTAMEVGVGEWIANGQDLALFGDNLVVDLALDEANLPVGSRVRAGTAVLEVPPSHTTAARSTRRGSACPR